MLIKHAVLTPSFALVDRREVFGFLDANPKHPANKKTGVVKGKVFPPFMKVIELRQKLKDIFADAKVSSFTATAPTPEESSYVRDLENKYNNVRSNLVSVENKWRELKAEVEDETDEKGKELRACKVKIPQLQNQITQLKENVEKLKKSQASESSQAPSEKTKKIQSMYDSLYTSYKKLTVEKQDVEDALEETSKKFKESLNELEALRSKSKKQKKSNDDLQKAYVLAKNKLKAQTGKENHEDLFSGSASQPPPIKVAPDFPYQKYYASLTSKPNQLTYLEELNELLECPILMCRMEDPSITESGHTVDGGVMDQYIGEKPPLL